MGPPTGLIEAARRSALIRAFRRQAWVRRLESTPVGRRVRRAVAGDAAPAARRPHPSHDAGTGIGYVIERYTVFQGTLRIAGRLDQPPGGVARLTLHLPDGAQHPIEAARSVGTRGLPFDQTIAVAGDPGDLARAVLVVTLRDGREVRIREPGRVVGDPVHVLPAQFRAMLQERPPGALLEVGSRARSGIVRRDYAPPGWTYSGFDIMAGPNVDVIGDAHELSAHYPAHAFDAVMAFSVLEHLLMPWKFAIEVNRVLRPGGIGVFTSHQCWPLHDQPWDYWRFSDRAWAGLLNAATGFEIIDARMGEPAFVVAQSCHPATAFADAPAAALASTVLFRKISETALQWPVSRGAITDTRYPPTVTPAAD
jgi:SAM-dependent methyltransferase